jgi:predicted nucleic acid-binding protein
LIDTSYWIECFRHYESDVSEKVETFIREDRAAATGVVLAEFLQGARTEAEMEEVKTSLEAVHWIETNERLYARAGEIGFELRRKGIAIPTMGCIVAAAAESIGGDLLTLDGHFGDIDSLNLL